MIHGRVFNWHLEEVFLIVHMPAVVTFDLTGCCQRALELQASCDKIPGLCKSCESVSHVCSLVFLKKFGVLNIFIVLTQEEMPIIFAHEAS